MKDDPGDERHQDAGGNAFYCAVCGQKATQVDHILNRAEGGAALDPANLQSMCAKHHHAKTVQESHRGMKRAAERRRRGRS